MYKKLTFDKVYHITQSVPLWDPTNSEIFPFALVNSSQYFIMIKKIRKNKMEGQKPNRKRERMMSDLWLVINYPSNLVINF